jgi:outer membrane immunogenic protein
MASVAALAFGIGAASAADLAAPAQAPIYTKAPMMAVPYSWTGLYIGAHVGGAWAHDGVDDRDEVPGTFSANASGFFGGGQIGYNIQTGPVVWGVEVDAGGMGLNTTTTQPGTGGIINAQIKGGAYADATGRIGYAWDRTLFYGKGGYAYYGGSITNTDVGEASAGTKGLSGWTAGGGIEQMINPAWSFKLEYMFSDFGTTTNVLPSDGDRYTNKLTVQTAKVGFNYRFGH